MGPDETASGLGTDLREVGRLLRTLAHAGWAAAEPPIGPKRTKLGSDGLTRAQAEQAFRRIQAEEAKRRPVEPVVEIVTVDQAAERLRERIAIEGARLSYRQNCESMQRVHISPIIGRRKVASVKPEDVERLASRMLARGSSPKTVRNVMTFLYSVFELSVKTGWAPANPVADAARPRRRRQGTPIQTWSSCGCLSWTR